MWDTETIYAWSRLLGFVFFMGPLMIILTRIIWVYTALCLRCAASATVEDRLHDLERDVEWIYKRFKKLEEYEAELVRARRDIDKECAKVTEQYEEIMNL